MHLSLSFCRNKSAARTVTRNEKGRDRVMPIRSITKHGPVNNKSEQPPQARLRGLTIGHPRCFFFILILLFLRSMSCSLCHKLSTTLDTALHVMGWLHLANIRTVPSWPGASWRHGTFRSARRQMDCRAAEPTVTHCRENALDTYDTYVPHVECIRTLILAIGDANWRCANAMRT